MWRLMAPGVGVALAACVACSGSALSPGSTGGGAGGTAGAGIAGAASAAGVGGAAGAAGGGGCPSNGCDADAGRPDGGVCQFDGAWYRAGETVVRGNSCDVCTCDASAIFICISTPCPKDGEAPVPGGVCSNDKSCNDDPAISATLGHCWPDHTCGCGLNSKSPFTGRCLAPGDDGSGCAYGGTRYGVGAVVPVLGCADHCSCAAPGSISCPPGSCLTCALGQDYSFTLPDGKIGAFYRPGDRISLVRILPGSDVGISCAVPLPTCGSPSGIDTSDLAADLADAQVQGALAASSPPVFGDRSLTNAPAFHFRTGSGVGGFSVVVGLECATATTTCDPTPTGVARLVADVNAVVAAALADPACASIR